MNVESQIRQTSATLGELFLPDRPQADGSWGGFDRLDLRKQPILSDHKLCGATVLAGAFYLELALSTANQAFGRTPRILRDVTFHRALFLSETSHRTIRIALSALQGRETVFRAYAEGEGGGEEAPNVVARLEIGSILPSDVPSVSLRELANRFGMRQQPSDFYAELERRGNVFGPGFRNAREILLGEGEALVRLVTPDGRGDEKEPILDPLLLDGCLQALVAAAGMKVQAPLVLASLEEIRLHSFPRPPLWAHASVLEQDGEELRGNIRAFDGSGRTAIELFGVRFRYLGSRDHEESPAAGKKRISIAATFTAEPLRGPLEFWAEELGQDFKVSFAPYNQPFQQLLDPSSRFSLNSSGMNVLLIRLDDWIKLEETTLVSPDPAEKNRLLEGHRRRILPNGHEIAHLNQYETDYLYEEIFRRRTYLKNGIVIEDGDCVIDVGANIGLFTLFVQGICPKSKIYAFEPSPDALAALRVNASLYGFNVEVFNCGLSDREGQASFTYYPNSSVFSGFHAETRKDGDAIEAVIRSALRGKGKSSGGIGTLLAMRLERESMSLPLRRLSDFIREKGIDRIDLLKIDAERSEMDVLKGIADEDWPIIRQTVIEVHEGGESLQNLIDLLIGKGFDVVVDEEELLREAGFHTVYASRGWKDEGRSPDFRPVPEAEAMDRNLDDLEAALRSFRTRRSTPCLICACPPSPRLSASRRQLVADSEERLGQLLKRVPGLDWVSSGELMETYPVDEYYDPYADALGHLPYTGSLFAALGTLIARRFYSLSHPPYKVIVLDCDQTLWTGYCGEGGPAAVTIDSSRKELQDFMVRQYQRGMLLCLCSKNNEEDVLAVFDAFPEMPLRLEHILERRINWRPKSQNVESLSEELGLGLESFIFIDDSPLECAEVQSALPQVLALRLPSRSKEVTQFLSHTWAFDRTGSTPEDGRRTALYREDMERTEYRQSSLSFSKFLKGLDLEVSIAPPSGSGVARAAQLTQRTNQFNFCTIRRTQSEITGLLARKELEALVVKVSDRFGDYGLVGLVLFKADSQSLRVDTFLLSCRVLGRGVEHRLLAKLGEVATERGRERIDATFVSTTKNRPALDFLLDVAREVQSDSVGGKRNFEIAALDASETKFDPDAVGTGDGPGRERSQTPGARRDRSGEGQSRLLTRIANDLNRTDRILGEIDKKRSFQPRSAGPGAMIPIGSMQRTVAEIWQKALGIDSIGIEDSFFELGGGSLEAIQVVSELNRKLHMDLPAVSVFDKTTIRSLTALLQSDGADSDESIKSRRGRGRRRRARRLVGLRRSGRARSEKHSLNESLLAPGAPPGQRIEGAARK